MDALFLPFLPPPGGAVERGPCRKGVRKTPDILDPIPSIVHISHNLFVGKISSSSVRTSFVDGPKDKKEEGDRKEGTMNIHSLFSSSPCAISPHFRRKAEKGGRLSQSSVRFHNAGRERITPRRVIVVMKTLAGLGITCLFCYFPSRPAVINRFRLDYRSEEGVISFSSAQMDCYSMDRIRR